LLPEEVLDARAAGPEESFDEPRARAPRGCVTESPVGSAVSSTIGGPLLADDDGCGRARVLALCGGADVVADDADGADRDEAPRSRRDDRDDADGDDEDDDDTGRPSLPLRDAPD